MGFDRPTLTELIARTASDIESRLAGTDARLRRQVLTVLARMLAGTAHGLHGHLAWLADQVLPDKAETDWLDRHGSIWGIARKSASYAAGNIVFTGISGLVVPAGTMIQRADGAEYATDADGTLVSGAAAVAVTAIEAGSAGNTEGGSAMTIVTPVTGINSAAVAASGGLTGGVDMEDDGDYRERIVARIQNPPHGGAAGDYEMWALEVSGVTRVWVVPLYLGEGTVGVFFVCDGLDPVIPDAGMIAAVQAAINIVRPITAHVYVLAPIAVPVDFEITLNPLTEAVKSTVTAELADLILRAGEPGGTIYLSQINEAISIAAGEVDHTLVAPAVDIEMGAGELAVMGTITWL